MRAIAGVNRLAAPGARRRAAADLVLTSACLTVGVLQLLMPSAALWADEPKRAFTTHSPATAVLIVAVCLPLFWWRRRPVAAFAVSWTALIGLILDRTMLGWMPFVSWILLYGVGAFSSTRRAVGAGAYAMVGLVIAWASGYPLFDAAAVARNGVLLCGCLCVGMVAGATRRHAGVRVELAEQRALVAAERATVAVVEERLRLARELHDIVAHSMSVINVQASMGTAAFDAQPAHARRALTNIETTSRDTLAELRGLLGVLRENDGSRADVAPAPTLRDLRGLSAGLESVGVTVAVVADGPLDIPAGADAFGYRIVQEALTNVLKHAEASHAQVTIRDDGAVVTITVSDDGTGPPPPAAVGHGHGIAGMSERAAAFGGTVEVGAAPGGGFLVRAVIPHTVPPTVGAAT